MKKFMKFLPIMLVAFIGCIALWSCDDDKDETIATDRLPSEAKTFISQYFPSISIVSAQKDKDDYEVVLSDGTRIDFNKSGEWTDVDAPVGKTVPTGFYPAAIDSYIATSYTGTGINEISKERRGYDVELVTGIDLIFDTEGNFISLDND